MRALMPVMTSRFSETTLMVLSRSMLDRLKMSGVVASPVRQMCRKQIISVSLLGMMCLGKAAEGVAPGAARIHHGGDAGVDAAQVGPHPVAVHPVVDVGMQVYQAGGHQLAGHVDHAGSFFDRDSGGYAGDLSCLYGYVVQCVNVLGGIDDRPAPDQQIVHLSLDLLFQLNISPTDRPL